MYDKPSSLAERCMQTSRLLNNLTSSSSVGSILYAEDDEDTRELVALMLARSNYKVVPAENHDDALLLARSNQFDLYMIDSWMPGGSGIDLCKKLREFDSSTPILFYSGAAFESDKQEAFASGAQGYLTKPVDNDELVEAVFRLISEAKNRKPNSKSAKLCVH